MVLKPVVGAEGRFSPEQDASDRQHKTSAPASFKCVRQHLTASKKTAKKNRWDKTVNKIF